MKFHRYKWYSKGEHALFFTTFFQTVADDWKNDIDLLAHHILIQEGRPFATLQKLLKASTIQEATADDEEEEIIHQLVDDFAIVSKQINEGYELAEKLHNRETIFLLATLQTKINHYRWKCQTYNRK